MAFNHSSLFLLLILCNYCATIEVPSSDDELIHQSTSSFHSSLFLLLSLSLSRARARARARCLSFHIALSRARALSFFPRILSSILSLISSLLLPLNRSLPPIPCVSLSEKPPNRQKGFISSCAKAVSQKMCCTQSRKAALSSRAGSCLWYV